MAVSGEGEVVDVLEEAVEALEVALRLREPQSPIFLPLSGVILLGRRQEKESNLWLANG